MSLVDYTVKNRVAYVTLNRPEKRNALNPEMIHDLKQAFIYAKSDEEARVIVLQANGTVFCAGADLAYMKDLQDYSYEENLVDSRNLRDLFYLMYMHPKVIIAEIHGHAIAGGCGLVSVCDFAFCSNQAKLGYTEVKIGFIPAIVMIFLIRKIGESKAKELLLTGNLIDAERAHEYGLINHVLTHAELNEFVINFAEKLSKENSEQSISTTKRMIAEIQGLNLVDALDYAAEKNAKERNSLDCKRGIAAFLAKEKIIW
ncbi:enoyl-CoA hydratase/isomerase family protein [Sediminitomix flava]|uniref:Methylglutaconyl-CoA hydratase n=1 Tax=Sediminitomix flava TaxID=379075 RepID=A0A315Z777_SEDFL|nr:enoyl-CoA hydratase-related protein [Sediminitomix flava]PWJ40771.1 methylglutaconyl-CoA hydratase [Sediminitomix flava]